MADDNKTEEKIGPENPAGVEKHEAAAAQDAPAKDEIAPAVSAENQAGPIDPENVEDDPRKLDDPNWPGKSSEPNSGPNHDKMPGDEGDTTVAENHEAHMLKDQVDLPGDEGDTVVAPQAETNWKLPDDSGYDEKMLASKSKLPLLSPEDALKRLNLKSD
jgi:hypothetical protein